MASKGLALHFAGIYQPCQRQRWSSVLFATSPFAPTNQDTSTSPSSKRQGVVVGAFLHTTISPKDSSSERTSLSTTKI